ncbi:MAG: hypothetical protein ACXWC9_04225 [Pseudobdellovibrionaceae bacterium]
MIQKTLIYLIALVSFQAWASGPSPQNMFWQFSPASMSGNKTKAFCATTKEAPYSPNLCLGEITRTDFQQPVEGYILDQRIENGPKETLKIEKVSGWKFLYRQDEFVGNADVYERSFEVIDASGRRSVLRETFDYYADYSDYSKMRTRKIEGKLPDGTAVSLRNIYFFY